MTKVLFICKQGSDSKVEAYGYFRKFSGLFNSARLVSEMLSKNGIESVVETARDNNDIDRLVTKHKPTHCIIEAYWVVPEKFAILSKLHPTVSWIIRIHSEMSFWATEGVAIEWSMKYLDYPNVKLAPNSERLNIDLITALSVKYGSLDRFSDKVVYLPNFYPPENRQKSVRKRKKSKDLHVGCFGALRPMKNQLIQAVAAIKYADKVGQKLKFHINGNRVEGGGEPVLKNLRNLFSNANNGFELIEHAWQPHSQFLEVLDKIDIGLQVSFTESFNIVAADMVTMNIPVVTSPEIGWVHSLFHADPTNTDSIVCAMYKSQFLGRVGTRINRYKLEQFVDESAYIWVNYFDNICS